MNNKFFITWLIFVFLLIGCERTEQTTHSNEIITKEKQSSLTPDDVVENLKIGNNNFVSNNLSPIDYLAQAEATAEGQYPEAIILSCIDSRVPVELIFDKGIGDIFVARVAGNFEDEDILGSMEYATAVAGSKLVVVLGHSHCGAVKGTIDKENVEKLGLENLNELLEKIEPAVKAALLPDEERLPKNHDLIDRVIEKNVELTIERIREKSKTLAQLEEEGKIKIVGAIYDIETGVVRWMQ